MHFPGFKTRIDRNVLMATGRVCPHELCNEYEVVIGYASGVRPYVCVTDPEPVAEAHGRRNPHLNGDGTVCLYDPEEGEWDDEKALALTIIPWTCEWLLFYEWWLATGTWEGGGVTLEDLLQRLPDEEVQRGRG